MADSYTLDQYVNDLRAITAKETDPVKIADLVAPLAKKFAQSPGWFHHEYRECDSEQGFGVHMLHEELIEMAQAYSPVFDMLSNGLPVSCRLDDGMKKTEAAS